MDKVCVGLAVHAEPERLQATLASVQTNTDGQYQVVLLPDGPDGATTNVLADLADYPQLATVAPRGLPACFNRLAQFNDASFIILLESGALVAPSWLNHLLAALRAHPHVGLAGPSTNRSWNQQGIFSASEPAPYDLARAATEAVRRFGAAVRTLEPLYSLADFCYAVRREVIEAIGLADEGYGLGPCWEMDYNIRAARAGWGGVWACAAYVHRAPFTIRRQGDEARLFEHSKRRYQDKFCGARLWGAKSDYRLHCRGDACPNFAPANLIQIINPISPVLPPPTPQLAYPQSPKVQVACEEPLVSCIMPTCDRLHFVPEAVRCFLKQDYPNLELVIVDDGVNPVAAVLPGDPRVRLIRLATKKNVGAPSVTSPARPRAGNLSPISMMTTGIPSTAFGAKLRHCVRAKRKSAAPAHCFITMLQKVALGVTGIQRAQDTGGSEAIRWLIAEAGGSTIPFRKSRWVRTVASFGPRLSSLSVISPPRTCVSRASTVAIRVLRT